MSDGIVQMLGNHVVYKNDNLPQIFNETIMMYV